MSDLFQGAARMFLDGSPVMEDLVAEAENEAAEFEKVIYLLLGDLPNRLGVLVGSILQDVTQYSDFCGWPTEEDVANFRREYEASVRSALAGQPREGFPARAEVIEHYKRILIDISATISKLDTWE